MDQMAGEENCRVVFRFDSMSAPAPVVHDQITSLKCPRFAIEIVDTRNASPPIAATVSIRMAVEVCPVIVGMDIKFDFWSFQVNPEECLDVR